MTINSVSEIMTFLCRYAFSKSIELTIAAVNVWGSAKLSGYQGRGGVHAL